MLYMRTETRSLTSIDDLLDLELAKRELGVFGVGNIDFRWSTGSTNDDLKAQGRKQAFLQPKLLSVIEQTGGRGTQGRVWKCLGDALIFSIGLPLPAFATRSPGLISIAAGAGIVRHLRTRGLDAALKWPNDIWVNDGKSGGILSEVIRDASGRSSVIVGIGLNLVLPTHLDAVTTSGWKMSALSSEPDAWSTSTKRTLLLCGLVADVLISLKNLEEYGIADFCSRFSLIDAFFGRRVFWKDDARGLLSEGIDNGIDTEGYLRVKIEDGEVLLGGGTSLVNAVGGRM